MFRALVLWVMRQVWLRQASFNGRVDGKQGIPPDGSDSVPPVMGRFTALHHDLALTAEKAWLKEDVSRHQRYSQAFIRAQDAAAEEAASHEGVAAATIKLEQVKAEADRLGSELIEPGAFYVSPGWYLILIIFLATLDIPITYFGLQALGLSSIMTSMLSVLVVTLLVVLGHAAGDYARQLNWGAGTLLTGVLLVTVVFTGSVTYLRETATEVVLLGSDGFDSLGATLVFGCVTVLTFFVPALLSYHRMPTPLVSQVKEANRVLMQATRSYRRARRRSTRFQERLKGAIHAREGKQTVARHQVMLIDSWLRTLQQTYLRENVRSRSSKQTPPGLEPDRMPRVAIPPALHAELRWDPPRRDAG
jgi:hypothetical protein